MVTIAGDEWPAGRACSCSGARGPVYPRRKCPGAGGRGDEEKEESLRHSPYNWLHARPASVSLVVAWMVSYLLRARACRVRAAPLGTFFLESRYRVHYTSA